MADKIQNADYVALKIKEVDAPTMWQHYISDLRPFSNFAVYKNDFHSYVADEWTITEVGTSTQTLLDVRNGVLRLTSGATEDNGNNLQLGGSADSETTGESWAPEAGKNLYFEIRLKSDDVTQHDFFVGLHVEDTTVVASRGVDYIGFRTDDGDALLDVETANTSVSSSETSVHTLVNDTWVKLGFFVESTTSIKFYVNDVLKSTLSTNIPTGLMKLTIAHLTGEGSTSALDIDYVVVAQNR